MMITGMFKGGPKIENGLSLPLLLAPLLSGPSLLGLLGAGAVVIKRGSLGGGAGGRADHADWIV